MATVVRAGSILSAAVSGAGGGAGTVTSVAAGNGMNFGTITTAGTVTLGTPSTLNDTTSNATTSTSHTHALSNVMFLTAAQTVAGVKTFSSFPVTPSAAPTTDYQVANKKYVDDNAGGGSKGYGHTQLGTLSSSGQIPFITTNRLVAGSVSVSGNQFVCAEAGVVEVCINVSGALNADNDVSNLYIYLNGGIREQIERQYNNDETDDLYPQMNISAIMPVSAGATLYAYCTNLGSKSGHGQMTVKYLA